MVKRSRARVQYSATQKLTELDFGRVNVTTNSDVGYQSIYYNRASDLQAMLETHKPYFIVPEISAGAYTGDPQTIQMDLSESKLSATDAGVYVMKGKVIVLFRNNWDAPCDLSFYLHQAIGDTSLAPVDIYNNALNDRYKGATDKQEAFADGLSGYTREIGKLWKPIGKVQSVHLEPGRQVTYTYSTNCGWWSETQWADNGSLNFTAKYTYALTVAIRGVLMHDVSDPSLVAVAPCQVDYMERAYRSWKHRLTSPMATKYHLKEDNTITTKAYALADDIEMQDADGDGDD